MSTLSVTTVQTANGTTDLTLKTGNTSNPSMIIQSTTGITTFGSASFNNIALYGISNNNAGVVGQSNTSIGVYGISNTSAAVFGQANTTGTGVQGQSNTGIGLYVQSNTGVVARFANATVTTATFNQTNVQFQTNNFFIGNTGTGAYNNTAANGYTILPNQMKMNFGVVVANSLGQNLVTFASPFTTNTYTVAITLRTSQGNTSLTNAHRAVFTTVNSSTMLVTTSNASVGVNTGVLGVHYLAIGPA